jgi:hypothetical protein
VKEKGESRGGWLVVLAVLSGVWLASRAPSGLRGLASPVTSIERENRLPGTSSWTIPNLEATSGIEGYADAVSAQAGDRVRLFVSTRASTFHVEAYRMGYYGGRGARLVWTSGSVQGEAQPGPTVDPATHMVEAHWHPSLDVTVQPDWPPGDYLLKLVGQDGPQRYVPLTVRDDHSHAALVIQNAVTTWQAYNGWGGYSLYHGPRSAGDFVHRSRVASFDRPYADDGAGDFLQNELPLVSFAESLGLDVTYWTDVDLHEHPDRLLDHRALVSLGHDEYWSPAMRAGAENARDHGVNLAFLGANAVFRRIRFEPSPLGADRRQVNYKIGREDPLYGRDDTAVTSDWREPPLPQPESSLTGMLYECNPVRADMRIADPSAWVFEGTGLSTGDRLHGVVGPEYDRVFPGPPTPFSVEILSHSPLRCRGRASFSDMSYYAVRSGAGVFATGTNWWICQLNASCPNRSSSRPDPRVRQITENVLRAFGQGPAGRQHPSHPNVRRLKAARPSPMPSPGIGQGE